MGVEVGPVEADDAIASHLLRDVQRVVAFAVFHVVIRFGLGVAAVAAGLAGDLLNDVKWAFVGELEPSRVVLLSSGLLVVLTSALVRVREAGGPSTDEVPP